MHEVNLKLPVHFYIDVSNQAAELAITQFQNAASIGSDKEDSLIEIFIIYDLFSWNLTQRNYPTYKKKLCAIVTFLKKYDYLCKHSYQSIITHTNHRSLTHFIEADAHENVYDNWADKLRRLNVIIKYILRTRNKIANNLSKTLFESDWNENTRSTLIAEQLREREKQWI